MVHRRCSFGVWNDFRRKLEDDDTSLCDMASLLVSLAARTGNRPRES
jgi:hypothetical protein